MPVVKELATGLTEPGGRNCAEVESESRNMGRLAFDGLLIKNSNGFIPTSTLLMEYGSTLLLHESQFAETPNSGDSVRADGSKIYPLRHQQRITGLLSDVPAGLPKLGKPGMA